MPTTWPDAARLARWVNLSAPTADESAILDELVVGVPPAVIAYCDEEFVDGEVPENVAWAALLWEGRLWQRRNSLDGTVGFGDAGVVTIRTADPDVKGILAPYKKVPIA